MTETALITMFGDALVSSDDGSERDALKGVVLERRDAPFIGLGGNRLVNAPPSVGIVALRPCVYQLHDAQGRV